MCVYFGDQRKSTEMRKTIEGQATKICEVKCIDEKADEICVIKHDWSCTVWK